MEAKINIDKLKALIANGISSIPKDEHVHEAVVVIGDTGVGKSTILNFLSGKKLTVRGEGLKPKLVCEEPTAIKIGHEKYSETSIPTRCVIQGLAFYDCPGFRDNKGEEYEISNSFFVQRLLDIYEKVKIVLMIDQSHVTQSRADKLPRLTRSLLQSFKSFNGIKEGVVVIINKADRDLEASDYGRQIKKMALLRNQRGPLFSEEEKNFLNYLVDQNRIKLFKSPSKRDRNMLYTPTECQNSIMPSIINSDYVKSKHILNIVSESAKIAIREYIDELTLESNSKIQRIALDIAASLNEKINSKGKKISQLLQIKQQMLALAEQIKRDKGCNILQILGRQLPGVDYSSLSADFESIVFFKGIYDKTSFYFSNLMNKSYSELSNVMSKLDNKIIRLEKQEREELERKQLLLKRKQLQNAREREKLELRNQMKQVGDIRVNMGQLNKAGTVMMKSLGDTLRFLDSLENEFKNLRVQASKLKVVNDELNDDFHSFEAVHLMKQMA